MSSKDRIEIAILDDYANIAPSKFAHLSSKVDIHSFPKTIDTKTDDGRMALMARLERFPVILTMRERTPFPRELLVNLPYLKLLLTTGAKNASIDGAACKELGITYAATSPPPNAVPTHSQTNEQCWALILGLAKGIASGDLRVKSTRYGWESGLTIGLAGKKLAVLGLGRLGAQAAVTGKLGFSMDVICWSTSLTQAKADEVAAKAGLPKGSFRVVGSKLELFQQADVLSVQYVLSDRSRGIVGREELAAMKKSALLVNTSRGPLVDEDALLEVLRAGRIAGAALDVFDVEPLPPDSPWRSQDWGKDGSSQVLLSPHMGYVEENTMHSWYEQQAKNVERWLNGEDLANQL